MFSYGAIRMLTFKVKFYTVAHLERVLENSGKCDPRVRVLIKGDSLSSVL